MNIVIRLAVFVVTTILAEVLIRVVFRKPTDKVVWTDTITLKPSQYKEILS